MVIIIEKYKVLIDDEDYNKIKVYKWYINKDKKNNRYTVRATLYKKLSKYNYKHKSIYIHSLIMNAKKGEVVDHKNHNTLDNRKCNLRICTNQQNIFNQKLNKRNTSGYKGVSFNKSAKKWKAKVCYNYKDYYLGLFSNILDAKKAYEIKAKELFKEFYNPI
jgi:hypothetical protein